MKSYSKRNEIEKKISMGNQNEFIYLDQLQKSNYFNEITEDGS